jgi:hypothetical protein
VLGLENRQSMILKTAPRVETGGPQAARRSCRLAVWFILNRTWESKMEGEWLCDFISPAETF